MSKVNARLRGRPCYRPRGGVGGREVCVATSSRKFGGGHDSCTELPGQKNYDDGKYAKVGDAKGQTERDLLSLMFTSEASLKAGKSCVLNIVEEGGVSVHCLEKFEDLRCRLQKRDKAIRYRCDELIVVVSELEGFFCSARDLKGQLPVARAYVAV